MKKYGFIQPLRTRAGLTLVELAVAMVLSGMMILALTSQFVAAVRFKSALEVRVGALREALVVSNHMARVLRFIDPDTLVLKDNNNLDRITATIKGGHLGFAPIDTTCWYNLKAAVGGNPPELRFKFGSEDTLISNYVTYLDTTEGDLVTPAKNVFNPATNEFKLRFNITKNGVTVPITTKIKIMDDDL